jgi:hypothetical protein
MFRSHCRSPFAHNTRLKERHNSATGSTFDEIITQEGTSRRRIQQIIELAFLAPDIVQMISEGRQPIGLTSEWVLRHKLPSDWQDQRALFATL